MIDGFADVMRRLRAAGVKKVSAFSIASKSGVPEPIVEWCYTAVASTYVNEISIGPRSRSTIDPRRINVTYVCLVLDALYSGTAAGEFGHGCGGGRRRGRRPSDECGPGWDSIIRLIEDGRAGE